MNDPFKKKYEVISADSPGVLSVLVSVRLEEGWELVGGMVHSNTSAAPVAGLWAQAVQYTPRYT